MLDYNDVRERINGIMEVGDTVKASAQILELNDVITKSEAEDTAELQRLNDDIKNKDNEIAELRQEVADIRSANADVMLKYGELLQHQTQQVFVEKKPEEDEPPKSKSWEEISKMD